MLIKEVILENFMSYEYARIPLKSGVNVICGPNGSGKSSILLGISVALGQSYTERSKKLSDLIRRGEDAARVTLVLNNSHKGEHRPISKIKKDSIRLTRGLRRDGKYWFELENKAVTKDEVKRFLSNFEVDPENMLIIMHQNMVQEFTVLSNQEKLKMVEAAVGLETYRQNVLDSQRKLSRILSENESLKKLLESAEQTLRYWREQHDRYQQKKQLNLKRLFLKRELTWVKISERENAISNLQDHIKIKEREILKIENEMKSKENKLIDISKKLHDLKDGYRGLLEERIKYEREKAEQESTVSVTHEIIKDVKLSQKKMDFCIDRIENLEVLLSDSLQKQLTEIKSTHRTLQNTWIQQSTLKSELIRSLTKQIREITSRILDVQKRTNKTSLEIEEINKKSLDNQINSALLLHRKNLLTKSLEEENKTLQVSLAELGEAIKKAEMEDGPRIVTLKKGEEILDEMRVTDGHLAALDDIREDVEHIYESYSKLYLELKEKIRIVSENREKALEEVKTRMRSWRSIIQTLLVQANLRYLTILSESQATGNVRITNEHDIEAAGLEIHVGFKGTDPVPLNAYTQSGGERSTATMAFLLALQQHVRSPFRAVDEYDIHMDPKNRESIARVLISSVKDSSAQYVAITPSQITFMERGVHIITVQNVDGASLIKEAV